MKYLVEEYGGLLVSIVSLGILMAVLQRLGVGNESGIARFLFHWGTGGF